MKPTSSELEARIAVLEKGHLTVKQMLKIVPPDADDTGPWNTALSLIGEFVPECDVCCSGQTGGDVCEPCGQIQAHIALGIQEGRKDSEVLLVRLREALRQKVAAPDADKGENG